ncbi:MAG TPA: NEW3 domain-containing protein, partial [Roseiarcus sp.]|nr:NEW3 domain-containing protein [Roseiarcus sp.]
FKEGYGSQELTSLPFKAGESKDVTVSIKPSPDVKAGQYPIPVDFVGDKAKTETKLTLDIAGQPELSLTGQNDLLSGAAYAGDQTNFPLVLRNTGSAPARDIKVSASEPSGWKISFEPKEIREIPVNGEQKVTAQVTPPAKAIDGDYMISMTASGGGLSQSVNYRVTVLTSTMWGVAGIGVIGVALLVLVGAVRRFGRR